MHVDLNPNTRQPVNIWILKSSHLLLHKNCSSDTNRGSACLVGAVSAHHHVLGRCKFKTNGIGCNW